MKRHEGSLISFMSNKVKETGGINLAQGLPGFPPPDGLIEALKKAAGENIHQYAPGIGNADLLTMIIEKYKDMTAFSRDNLLVTNGATEAITTIFIYLSGIIEKPFSVLTFDPVYESYSNLPKIFGAGFVPFSFDEFSQIDFAALGKTISEKNVKAVFVNSPGNPYGRIWSKDEVLKILKMSLEQKFFVIFDAVYQDIYFGEKPYIPVDTLGENVFYVNSFSKMLSITGWRIGYVAAHEKHIKKMRSIHDYTGLSSPSVLQRAIALYLKESSIAKDYLPELRKNISASFDIMKSALIPLGFSIPKIDGGYFIWTKMPDRFSDGYDFAIDFYDKKRVAVVPGIHFSENGARYIRFNIAKDKKEIIEAAGKLKEYLTENK